MRIGILGGGQLARMMAQAGQPMGHTFTFLDPTPDACAFEFGEKILAAYDDATALEKLAKNSDVVTFEFENVPAKSVEILSKHVVIHPSALPLEIAQDRLKEKTMFGSLQIPTNRFLAVDSLQDLKNAREKLGLPLVLKTRSQGYDGKGQSLIRSEEDLEKSWEILKHAPLIAEQFVKFDREISMIGVRNGKNEILFYDVCENVHRDGILRLTKNRPNDTGQEKAQTYVQKILEYFNYVGVLTLELFQKGNELLANEIAPRVHNSGHWTIEGAVTSQFQNHLLALLNMPLGSTSSKGFSAMVNCIGELPTSLAQNSHVHFHDYGKKPRPNRKIGHITLVGSSPAEVDHLVHQF
jgi:5-(carboxyamino)imidazole ribonucleotide synthase